MRRLRFLIAVPLIMYCIYNSRKEDARHAQNKQPREDVRQAGSIITMWSSGLFADQRPSQPLAEAEKRVNAALASNGDGAVMNDANKLRQWLTTHPHYIRFTDHFRSFADEFATWRELLQQIGPPDQRKLPEGIVTTVPKFLVVIPRRHPAEGSDPNDDPLFFDPEMIETLGEACAAAPQEVRTIIALYFVRIEAGEYRMANTDVDAKVRKEFPGAKWSAYLHGCDLLAIDVETRAIVHAHRFLQADPEKVTVQLLGPEKSSKDGYGLLREQVQEYIQQFIIRQAINQKRQASKTGPLPAVSG